MSLGLVSFSQDKSAYRLYDTEGTKVEYQKMIAEISDADVIFFGELHDNPIAHWLEYEVTTDLFKTSQKNLTLGAEMFEADNQLLLDEYLGLFCIHC